MTALPEEIFSTPLQFLDVSHNNLTGTVCKHEMGVLEGGLVRFRLLKLLHHLACPSQQRCVPYGELLSVCDIHTWSYAQFS